jgi:hypothetical protein
MRLALRRHLPDAEDLVGVLKVLSGWIAQSHSTTVRLLPMDVVTNARGVMVAKPVVAKGPEGPPLEKVSFCLACNQTILSITFLSLGYLFPSDSAGCVFLDTLAISSCA